MANLTEPSSSLSFASSSYLSSGGSSYNISASNGSYLSNGSSSYNISVSNGSYLSNGSSTYNISVSKGSESGISYANPPPHSHTVGAEIVSLKRLSSNLEWLLLGSEFDCSDAEIIVEGESIGIHRCILAARSPFFRELFIRENKNGSSQREEKKPKYFISNLVPNGTVGYEAFKIFLNYLYTGKLTPSPLEVSTCVDPICAHDACRPAVNFAVELMYASVVFQITELVSLFQRRLCNFVEKALVEDVIPILLVAFSCQLENLRTHCIQRVARSNLDSISLEKELPLKVAEDIKSLRLESCYEEPNVATMSLLQEKNIRKLYKALDSDDIELVKLLLTESSISLDDAYALHYAAAYSDSKIVAELLELGQANVNLKNTRGYTILHVAAMRREPAVIVSLLTKGASVSEITDDGQSTVRICRRLTRAKDYHEKMEQGKESNKYRICIDILEREERMNPMAGESSVSSPVMADELHMRLLHLENRVAFAKLLFPTEAKLAMDIAHTGTTSEFSGISASKNIYGNLNQVDLNETPTTQTKKLHSRMSALLKTGTASWSTGMKVRGWIKAAVFMTHRSPMMDLSLMLIMLCRPPFDDQKKTTLMIDMELGGINTAMEREKVSLQELMSVVKGMMRDTEVAVRSYMMLCPRFLHAGPPAASNVNPPGQFSGTMALSNTASQPKATSIVPLFDFYSGVPRRPSPFLQHTTARFEKYLAECRQWIEELEQLFRLDSDENGRSGSDMALLNSLPAVMSNLHDFFVHVAAKLENLHQQVESMRSAYLADQKRRGDANDPFLEADRREMAKQEAAARRVHPTLHMPGFSQPSTQIVGLFASSAMPGASVALQSSVGSSASSSASVFPSFNTPSSSSTAASTSPSLFATPFAATPASNLFGPSVSSQPSSFFGASTPSLGSSPAVGSTSFLSMPSFATGVGTGSGASFGAASKSAKPKSRTARR